MSAEVLERGIRFDQRKSWLIVEECQLGLHELELRLTYFDCSIEVGLTETSEELEIKN